MRWHAMSTAGAHGARTPGWPRHARRRAAILENILWGIDAVGGDVVAGVFARPRSTERRKRRIAATYGNAGCTWTTRSRSRCALVITHELCLRSPRRSGFVVISGDARDGQRPEPCGRRAIAPMCPAPTEEPSPSSSLCRAAGHFRFTSPRSRDTDLPPWGCGQGDKMAQGRNGASNLSTAGAAGSSTRG